MPHQLRFQPSDFRPQKFLVFSAARFFKKSRGFTLIELLVALAIISILTVFALAGYNNFSGRQQVKNAALGLESDLRKMQSFAVSGQKNPNPHDPKCVSPTVQPMLFYSLSFDLYSSPFKYTPKLACGDLDAPKYVDLSIVSLPTAVSIVDIAILKDAGAPAPSSCWDPPATTLSINDVVEFYPLNGGVILTCYSGHLLTAPAEITIHLASPAASYKVHVTTEGVIYAKQE